MKYYEVTSENVVNIWPTEEDAATLAPSIKQPSYPNGDAWTTEEATEWAELFTHQADEDAEWLPGISKEEPKLPKPEAPVEEIPAPLASAEEPTPAE